jgi:uncharacterized protein YndB with AHSA1/START domain
MRHIGIISLSFFTALALSQSHAQTVASTMQVNPQAPVFQTNQILIQATPEQVWAVLTDVNRWPEWNTKITRASLKTTASLGSTFDWKVNGARIHSTLHTVQANRLFGWSGTTFGGSAIHNWRLEPTADGGTVVHVEESMQGWLVGLFKQKMNRDLKQDMAAWLEALKRESEKE